MINVSKPIIGQKEINAVLDTMRTGMIVQGPKTQELENKFALYCGTKYAVAFNSGTAAIHAGLYAMGIKEGDEVITTPFTFVATANPILMQKAKIIFADIGEEDFNIDPKEVENKISLKTKAVIPVDLYGQIYNYKDISRLAKKYKFKILEDACQAVGAEFKNTKSGNFGEVAAFSLYATKNMMCGEGGLITTNHKEITEKCKMFRHHGQSEKTRYQYFDLGYNYRLTDMNASIALVQLQKIDQLNEKRRINAKKLSSGLTGIKGIVPPKVKDGFTHVFHQYTIRITNDFKLTREKFIETLREKEINTGIYYPKPLHLHPYFQKMGYREGDFPIAEKVAKEVVSLPVHPSLTDKEVDYVIDVINNI